MLRLAINSCLLVFCGSILIPSVIVNEANGGLVFEEPETINLSFTIRSFLPITCAPSPEIDRYWPGPPAIISREKGCPLKADRAAGTILAHPDFQIGYEVWRNTSAPPNSYYWAPGSGTPGLLNPLQSQPRQEVKKGKFQLVSMTNAITPLVEPYLEIDPMTGLGKPVYCKKARCGVPYHYEDPSWPYINEAWVEKPNLASLADESTFRVWYRDDSRYNRRVGISMMLNRTSSNVFVFDSANEPSGNFHPLDRFIIEEPAAVMPVTANQEAREGDGHKYWFTSECHSFFQYLPGKKFSFQGDDDFLAYINNRLVVDLSGMHEPYESSIDLDVIANEIGLVPGKVYPLDIFHAERRMTDSNFKMTTNLVSGCTVLRVGLVTFAQSESNNRRWIKNVGSTVEEDGTIILTLVGETGMTGYAFHSLPQNVAQGFTMSFAFKLTGTLSGSRVAEGFAVVIHRDSLGISNMNGGSSGHLGARNFENSVVVAFDLCADRNLPGHYSRALQDRCKVREVRVHRAFNGKRSAPASASTMALREGINFRVRQLVETRSYRVRIVYYGNNPNWLEVYIDDSLLVTLKNFDVARDLGDRHAYIGLTSSTGHLPEHTAGIAITDWKIETIDIEPKYTQIVSPDLLTDELIADGKKSLSFRLDVKDGCNETVSYGGYGEWALAWLERVGDADRRRRLLDFDDGELFEYEGNSTVDEYESINSTERHVILADVIDHDNGTYDLAFRTTVTGEYKVFVVFGPCRSNLSEKILSKLNDTLLIPQNDSFSSSDQVSCWFYQVPSNMLAVPPAKMPETPEIQPAAYPWHIVIGVASGLGGTLFCCLLLLFVLLGARRRWREEKKFVTAGQLAVLEQDVQYESDPMGLQINRIAHQVEKTNRDILRLRAVSRTNHDEEVDQMRDVTKVLQEEVRSLKRRQQEKELDSVRPVSGLPPPRPKPRFEPNRTRLGDGTIQVDKEFEQELKSLAVFVWTKHPDASFRACFSQRDVDLIEGFVDDYPDRLVGGDLFGVFDPNGDCQILHATGPGQGSTFGRTAFSQDPQYTSRCLAYLNLTMGLTGHRVIRIGKWVSFHKLQEPVQAMLQDAWTEAKSCEKLLLLAVHIKHENVQTGQKQVIISPILFENGSTVHKFGELCVLDDAHDMKAKARHEHLENMRNEQQSVSSTAARPPTMKRSLFREARSFRREKKAPDSNNELVVFSLDSDSA